MADRIRRFDWAATSLGPARGWPAGLRATVELMLSSPQLANLAVGPERLFLYNDEAARHYGGAHPAALGQPLSDVFPHEYGRVAGFYDRVFAGESLHVPAQPLDPARSGTEEVFDAYLAPVRDEDGTVIATYMSGFANGDRRRAEAALAQELANTRQLQEVSGLLIEGDDSGALYGRILDAATAIMRADFASIQAYDPERKQLRLLGHKNFHPASARFWDRVSIMTGTTCGCGLREGERIFAEDASAYDPAGRDHYRLSGIVSVQSTPLTARDGRLVGMISTHWRRPFSPVEADFRSFDILVRQTADAFERSLAERALRNSEERLRQFGEASQDVLWTRDAETLQWTYLTPAFEKIYGIGRKEALTGPNYRNWLDLIVPEDRDHAMANIERVCGGEQVAFEFRIRRPNDGAIRWMRNTDFPIADEHGKVVTIGGIGSDITELREAERRLQALMAGIPQFVWRAYDGGQWTWASPQWTRYTGQAERDSHGLGWLETVHPDDRAATMAIWADAIEHGMFEAEYRLCHAIERRYRWFQTRATPVRDAGGRIVEWLGTSTDIDDLRRLQVRQHVLVAELQHRVRNILAVVRSMFGRTAEMGGEIDVIVDHFQGRLDALARTQVAATHNAEGSADLENLIRDELLSVGASDGPNLVIAGPDITLPTKAAETIGLAVHELTTNAIKYGALKIPVAKLVIRWKYSIGDGMNPQLVLSWIEQGVPAVSVTPTRYGFGRELIEEALPYRLGAETEFQFTGGGVSCTISLPLPGPGASLADARDN